MAKGRRVIFTFDERSLALLKQMVQGGEFRSMGEAVRDSLALNRALKSQASKGFTEIVVRNPATGRERVMVWPE